MLEKINNSIFRIYRIIGREIIKRSSNPRPSSMPYVTGDGFRNLADHIYDKAHLNIDTEKIKGGDLVFVGDSIILSYLKEIHPRIKESYVLITHNGDEQIDEERTKLMDEKIIKWFGINVVTNHPRVIPLPLGIENKHWYLFGIPSVFRWVIEKNHKKRDRIFYGFTVASKPEERQPALDVLKRSAVAETVTKWKNFLSYLHLLATYKFVASPPGSSIEGHRTWDALYIGSVPIVKASITTNHFNKLGVPMWVLEDWNELESVDEAYLARKFDEIQKSSDPQCIYMDYWINMIKKA